MEVGGQLHATHAEKSVLILSKRLGRPQNRSICFEEEIIFLIIPGIEPQFLGHTACSTFIILIVLSCRHSKKNACCSTVVK